MRGPVVDIVMLLLLILFFGKQQSSRAQKYYRLWFSGWIFILLSYAVWEPAFTVPVQVHIQDVVRYDLSLAGSLLFMMSFLAGRERLWTVVSRGLCVGIPAIVVLDALDFLRVPAGLVAMTVVVWHAYGLRAAYVLIPKPWRKARAAIYMMCVIFVAVDLRVGWMSGGKSLFDWALVEVTLCSAVLFMGIAGRRSFAAWMGSLGFLLWGLFYASDVLLRGTEAVKVIYVCWTLPKYLVAASMILKTFEDETGERTELTKQFQRLYEDFRMMFEGHPNPMWVHAKKDGRILSTNEAAVSRYGYTAEEFKTMLFQDLEVTDEAEASLIEALYEDGKTGFARHQFKDGRKIWASLSQSAITFQDTDAVFQIARDVTDRVEMAQKRMHAASHDLLTGLPNRTLLEDRILQSFKRCEREGRKATLLTIDVDHFKQINDTHGHQVGDECLQIAAARLASKIRQVDTLARVGGEEFTAIVGGLHCAEDAGKVADSLLRVFREPLQIGDLDVLVTVSIGIAIYPDDALDAEALKRRSDEALYAAKRGGRNRAVFASGIEIPAMVEVAKARVRREFDVTMVTEESMGS